MTASAKDVSTRRRSAMVAMNDSNTATWSAGAVACASLARSARSSSISEHREMRRSTMDDASKPNSRGPTPGRSRTPTAVVPVGRAKLQARVSGPQTTRRPVLTHSTSMQPSGTSAWVPVGSAVQEHASRRASSGGGGTGTYHRTAGSYRRRRGYVLLRPGENPSRGVGFALSGSAGRVLDDPCCGRAWPAGYATACTMAALCTQ